MTSELLAWLKLKRLTEPSVATYVGNRTTAHFHAGIEHGTKLLEDCLAVTPRNLPKPVKAYAHGRTCTQRLSLTTSV